VPKADIYIFIFILFYFFKQMLVKILKELWNDQEKHWAYPDDIWHNKAYVATLSPLSFPIKKANAKNRYILSLKNKLLLLFSKDDFNW